MTFLQCAIIFRNKFGITMLFAIAWESKFEFILPLCYEIKQFV